MTSIGPVHHPHTQTHHSCHRSWDGSFSASPGLHNRSPVRFPSFICYSTRTACSSRSCHSSITAHLPLLPAVCDGLPLLPAHGYPTESSKTLQDISWTSDPDMPSPPRLPISCHGPECLSSSPTSGRTMSPASSCVPPQPGRVGKG